MIKSYTETIKNATMLECTVALGTQRQASMVNRRTSTRLSMIITPNNHQTNHRVRSFLWDIVQGQFTTGSEESQEGY
jgi:hypothetical protein